METKASKKNNTLRKGFIIFILLAILTAIEFAVSSTVNNPIAPLTVLAIVKGGLIVSYFMHLMQLWREEEA